MRYTLNLGVLISLLVFSFCAEAQTPPHSAVTQVGWLDHWRLSTLSFGTIQRDNSDREFFKVIGTGLLVATDPQTPYIITAKHVFEDTSNQWKPSELRLRFAWQEHRSVYDYLGTSLKLSDSTGKPLWLAANGADIAAIPIMLSQLPLEPSGPQPHAISMLDIAPKDDMFEGAIVFVLGFPGIVGNEYLVRAITRSGIVAWLNPEDPYGKPFLIDANIYPGNSGGPVLKIPTGTNKQGGFIVGGKATFAWNSFEGIRY